jgi:hypothetical protein
MQIFLLTSSLFIFSAYASFDLLLPPLPPSGLYTQKYSRTKFIEAIDKLQNELRNLPLTFDQRANFNKLLFVYIKAYAYKNCAPSFVAVGKSSLITNLLAYIVDCSIITKESDFINWTTLQNQIKNSFLFLYLRNAGNHLGDIIRSFEMIYPADSKELEKYICNKSLFSKAAIYINTSYGKYTIKGLDPKKATVIYDKIDPLKEKLKDSLFADYKLVPYEAIFEPLRGQFGLKDWRLVQFSLLFLDYALAAFYEEHFNSNQELSEALFGTGLQLTDLNGKEINWCFEIASLRQKYLLELKKEFPVFEDDSILLQLKSAMWDLLGPHKTHSNSFVVDLGQTRYFPFQ